jgi:hypothetical protein
VFSFKFCYHLLQLIRHGRIKQNSFSTSDTKTAFISFCYIMAAAKLSVSILPFLKKVQ